MNRFILPAFLLLLAAPVQAKVITYDWTGRVVTPSWKMAIDDLVHGTMEIDDQAPRTIGDGQPEYFRTYNAVHVTVDAGGDHFDFGPRREWTIQSGAQGVTDCYLPTASPIYYSFDWNVSVRANSLDLFASRNLDKIWTGGSWGMEVSDPAHGYFTDGFDGIIQSLTRRTTLADAGDSAPTPEPSTFILMGSALSGFALLRRKRGRLNSKPNPGSSNRNPRSRPPQIPTGPV